MRVLDRRPRHRWHDDGHLVGTRWNVDCRHGFLRVQGPVFRHATNVLSGAGLAAGIAWINSIGNLGGFLGPWYVGVMKDLTGSYAGGLYGLALLGLVAAIVCALFLHIPSRTSSAAAPPIGATAG